MSKINPANNETAWTKELARTVLACRALNAEQIYDYVVNVSGLPKSWWFIVYQSLQQGAKTIRWAEAVLNDPLTDYKR